MAARELSKERFKGPTHAIPNPVTGNIQTTATEILRNNPDRILWLAVNLSAQDGYIGWDREVGPARGIPVPANGGYVIILLEEDGELVTQAVFAISPGGAATWYIVEVERL